jgi:hypothetical protein
MSEYHYADNPECWKDLDTETQQLLCDWIIQNICPEQTPNPHHSSYGMKHRFQADTGIYVYNGQFKAAMQLCGFKAVNKNEQNWHYRICEKSPAFEYPRARYW